MGVQAIAALGTVDVYPSGKRTPFFVVLNALRWTPSGG